MNRVATFAMHNALFGAIGRSQQKLASTQLQMTTGKKVNDFAGLGTRGGSTLSARSLLARESAYKGVADRLGTTLALYDAHLSGTEEAIASVRTKLLTALGTGQSAGLQGALEEAFEHFRAAMNADEAGVPLFTGSLTASPALLPSTLADTAGVPSSAAFANDDVRARATVSDNQQLQFGITASEVGTDLYEAFRTMAEAGPIGATLTNAQNNALKTAIAQFDQGLKSLRATWAENGRKQAQVETLTVHAEQRSLILQQLISRNEDADMAQVASDLTQQRTALEASYNVFARLSNLSLLNYLR